MKRLFAVMVALVVMISVFVVPTFAQKAPLLDPVGRKVPSFVSAGDPPVQFKDVDDSTFEIWHPYTGGQREKNPGQRFQLYASYIKIVGDQAIEVGQKDYDKFKIPSRMSEDGMYVIGTVRKPEANADQYIFRFWGRAGAGRVGDIPLWHPQAAYYRTNKGDNFPGIEVMYDYSTGEYSPVPAAWDAIRFGPATVK